MKQKEARVRLGVRMGASLFLLEIGGYAVNRFSVVWWGVHLLEVGIITVGFLMVVRRVAKLEAKVEDQGKRLSAIAGLVRWLIGKDEGSGEHVERVLRSVS